MPSSFDPFEVTAAHLIYVGLGFFIVIFGMLSLFIKEKLYLGEAPLALIFGIIVGPAALNLFNPISWGDGASTRAPGGHVTNAITLEVMRVTIALSVFAVGVELPKKYLLRHWKSIAMLLGPVMVWGWLVTAGLILLLVPGMDFLNSLVVAACVTPTDPILAQAVVGGPWAEKHVPAHLRHMLQCESGCNDGAAFPFLYLALFLTTNRGNEGHGIAEWFYDALAYQIVFGTLLGALVGWAARKAMRFSERKRLVDRESFVAQYVSLAIASMGVNVLLGSDDLLAAFACGTAFAWDGWFTKQTEDSNFSNIIDLLFNTATFIYIGALMPWYEFAHAAESLNIWRCFVLAIAVLALKRIPIILALWRWIPDIKTFREAMFSGHFGPMGVGAIFIATLGRHELPEEIPEPPETANDVLALTIQPIVFFLVLCSVAVHGLTVPFFAFSKRATTITRTWSRAPSFSDAGGDPGWMNRMKRFATGDTMHSVKDGQGADGMTEIQRVLNAQLGVIGKGAIGGDAEKELRGESPTDNSPDGSGDDSSASKSRFGLLNTRTERDLELAEGEMNEKIDDAPHDEAKRAVTQRNCKRDRYDDLDDWELDEMEDPSCEWGGDNTAEMKLFMAKRAERRENRRRQAAQERAGDNGDMGEAPMDREIISGAIDESDEDEDVREDKQRHSRRSQSRAEATLAEKDRMERESIDKYREEEERYPKARSWLEGNQLVIEYLKSRSDEPDVRVVELTAEEADQIGKCSQDERYTVASAWLESHQDELDHHVEDGEHREWHPAETARKLVATGALQSWMKSGNKNDRSGGRDGGRGGSAQRDQSQEETSQERSDRARMMYEALNWRNGDEEDEGESSRPTLDSRRDDEHAIDTSSSRSSAGAGSPSPARLTTSRSKSPPVVGRRGSSDTRAAHHHLRQHFAAGGRRPSMRRKALAGKAYLGGREVSEIGSDAEESATEFIDEEPSSQDTKSSTGLLRSPDELRAQRAASNGGLPASVSFLDTGDTRHDRVDGAACGVRKTDSSYRRSRGRNTRDGSGKPQQRSFASQPSTPREDGSRAKADKSLYRTSSAGSAFGIGKTSRSAPDSPVAEGPSRLTFVSSDEEGDGVHSSATGGGGGSKGGSSSSGIGSMKNKKPSGRLSAFLSSLTSSSSSVPTSQGPTSAPRGGEQEDLSLGSPETSRTLPSSNKGRPSSAGAGSSTGMRAFQLPSSSAANEDPTPLAALNALNPNRTDGGSSGSGSGSGNQTPGTSWREDSTLTGSGGHPQIQGANEGVAGRGILDTPENGSSGSATPMDAGGSVVFAAPPSRNCSRTE